MKSGHLLLLAIIWLILTVALTLSIVGLLLFIPGDTERSTWMQFGLDLLDRILDEKIK
jgi:hypothetical protein